MKPSIKFIVFITVLCSLYSCRKQADVSVDSSKKSSLTIEFDNVAGESNLALNAATYKNTSGESFTVSKLKYFVSNFVLTKKDGTVYTVPQEECYFLINEADFSSSFARLNVPEGEYKTLQFTIGVDSARNTLDVSQRTGALDIGDAASDMYWDWSSGYIFFKMEGTSPASTASDNRFMYHIGGFSADIINNIRTVTIDLSEKGMPLVKESRTPNVHLFVDVLKMFDGTEKLSIAEHSAVMSGSWSAVVANNYVSMFSHGHTEN